MTWIKTLTADEGGEALARAIEAQKELYPVVTLAPRRRTVFYHKACGPKMA